MPLPIIPQDRYRPNLLFRHTRVLLLLTLKVVLPLIIVGLVVLCVVLGEIRTKVSVRAVALSA